MILRNLMWMAARKVASDPKIRGQVAAGVRRLDQHMDRAADVTAADIRRGWARLKSGQPPRRGPGAS